MLIGRFGVCMVAVVWVLDSLCTRPGRASHSFGTGGMRSAILFGGLVGLYMLPALPTAHLVLDADALHLEHTVAELVGILLRFLPFAPDHVFVQLPGQGQDLCFVETVVLVHFFTFIIAVN